LAPSALPAQTSPTSTLPLAEVRFMSWEQAQSGLFTTTDGRDFKPVNAPAYAFGRPSQVRGDLPLRLYERVMRDRRPVYEIVAEAAIEPGFRRAQAYLVRQPDHDGRRSYRLIAMSNDPDAFRVGEVRVFNFSPYHCMVRIGDTPVGMAPLEWRTLSATPDRKHRVALAATLQVADAWTPVARGLTPLRENFRGPATPRHPPRRHGSAGMPHPVPPPRPQTPRGSRRHPAGGGCLDARRPRHDHPARKLPRRRHAAAHPRLARPRRPGGRRERNPRHAGDLQRIHPPRDQPARRTGREPLRPRALKRPASLAENSYAP